MTQNGEGLRVNPTMDHPQYGRFHSHGGSPQLLDRLFLGGKSHEIVDDLGAAPFMETHY